MSLRARLVMVLASVMVAPLVAAWVAVGVLVPQSASHAAQSAADRSAGGASVALADQCAVLGDTARALAYDLSAQLSAGAQLSRPAAERAVAAATSGHPGVTAAVLSGADLLAAAGPSTDALRPEMFRAAAAASCARRQAPAAGPPSLTESVPVMQGGREVARAVCLEVLDDTSMADLIDRLGLTGRVVLLDTSGDGAVPEVVAGAGGHAEPGEVLRVVAGGELSGDVAGLRYQLQPAPPGVPYAVLALQPVPGSGLQQTLFGLFAAAAVLAFLLVRTLAARLTGPLAELTSAAGRLGGGDLTARVGVRGEDEVGTLGQAFDAMADQLQGQIAELETSRDALRDTFARFGEALGRTHDVDGLLYTVVEAAMLGADAVVGTALLSDGGGLEERVSAVRDGGPPAVIGALDDLGRLAAEAVRRDEAAVAEQLPSAGPAIAVPLRRHGRTVGALAVARADGAGPMDDIATGAVEALAAHAGTAIANVQAHEETRRQSVTDPLTGTGNFRQLTTTLNHEVERATRFGRPLSVLMLDLDHFKQVNDTLGHGFGDAVLREFAHRLTECLREVDVVARYGGEEFAVVLPETDANGATAVATRIVTAIRSRAFEALGHTRAVTVSVGVASFPDHGRSAAEVMRAADSALYTAKRGGRDRWCVAGGAAEGKSLTVAR